jgi:hypothetical protein
MWITWLKFAAKFSSKWLSFQPESTNGGLYFQPSINLVFKKTRNTAAELNRPGEISVFAQPPQRCPADCNLGANLLDTNNAHFGVPLNIVKTPAMLRH